MNPPLRPCFADGRAPTAFVLNVSTAGLGAIRSLGRADIPVVGIDPDPKHIGFQSKFAQSLVSPHPVKEPDDLAAFLVEQGKQLDQPGILSPASDAFVLFLSRYRDDLSPYFRFILPPPELVEASVDKRRLYELAQRVGVGYATTHYPATMDDVHRIKHELEYPAYIKPYHSHLWQIAFPGVGKGIKVDSAEALVAGFERVFAKGVEAMVQSIIVGPASNIRSVRVYINAQGELLGAFTNRKIRQFPTEFGRGALAESIHDPAVMELGLRFFRDIGYRGFGLIEFKLDDRDGQLKATDLNPRWLKTVNIATDAGIDFPLLHYLDLAGCNPPPQMEFRAGVKWIDTIGDLAASWNLYRAGELSPMEWARTMRGIRSHAVFARDDLKPWLQEYDYGRRLLRAPLRLVPGR